MVPMENTVSTNPSQPHRLVEHGVVSRPMTQKGWFKSFNDKCYWVMNLPSGKMSCHIRKKATK